MKFRSMLDKDLEQVSNPGSKLKEVFKARLDKNGKKIIEKKGTENLYDYIQSFADSCDINLIIKKFVATGDESLLTKKAGTYMDLTDMPENYFDMINKINDAKEEFDKLPESVRKKYDYDADKFIGAIGSKDWFESLMIKDINGDGKIDKNDIKSVSTDNNVSGNTNEKGEVNNG